jgi:hypothetical protein
VSWARGDGTSGSGGEGAVAALGFERVGRGEMSRRAREAKGQRR